MPTDAQKTAGNYAKEHRTLGGLRISIENPAGSVRSGKDADGRGWFNTMTHDYGYVRGMGGNDKDHLDVFLGPGDPVQSPVHVVDQVHPDTGKFDEHKVMLGFPDAQTATDAYHANYDPSWKGADSVTPTTFEAFKQWGFEGDKRKPFAEGGAVKSYATDRAKELSSVGRGLTRGIAGALLGLPGNLESGVRAGANLLGQGSIANYQRALGDDSLRFPALDDKPTLPDADYVKERLPVDAPTDPAGQAAEKAGDYFPAPGSAGRGLRMLRVLRP